MTSYAEHLGIDLVKLEAERHYHYKTPKYSAKAILSEYEKNAINPPVDLSEDWQPITRSANRLRLNVETLRRWTKQGFVRHEKRSGRTWVYYPDAQRHAENPKPTV